MLMGHGMAAEAVVGEIDIADMRAIVPKLPRLPIRLTGAPASPPPQLRVRVRHVGDGSTGSGVAGEETGRGIPIR